MRYLNNLSLWVHNVVSRWKCSEYQNKFVDTQLFIKHELKKEDRMIILLSFDKHELDEAHTELLCMEYIKPYMDEVERRCQNKQL